MESLALFQCDPVQYAPKASSRLSFLESLSFQLPSSVWMGLMGCAVVLTMVATGPMAQASVRLGNQCSAVSSVQSALSTRGYAVGPVDGAFGTQTHNAVLSFQTRNSLAADGVVGDATAQALGITAPACVATASAGNGGGGGAPASANKVSYRISTAGSPLNVRSTPGGPIIGSVPNGGLVTAIGVSQNWAALDTGGWVNRDFLITASLVSGSSTGGGGAPSSPTKQVATNGSSLMVRQEPGGSAIATLPNGTAVRVITTSGDWSKIDQGWVASGWLR
jgi:peptidoglycan hydrolase-like protein with peptidoglycan-binding domain